MTITRETLELAALAAGIKAETVLYPIAEVQGLYRTIAELRQPVAAAAFRGA